MLRGMFFELDLVIDGCFFICLPLATDPTLLFRPVNILILLFDRDYAG